MKEKINFIELIDEIALEEVDAFVVNDKLKDSEKILLIEGVVYYNRILIEEMKERRSNELD